MFHVLINLCGTIVVVGDYFKVMILCQTLRLADDNIGQLRSEVVFCCCCELGCGQELIGFEQEAGLVFVDAGAEVYYQQEARV